MTDITLPSAGATPARGKGQRQRRPRRPRRPAIALAVLLAFQFMAGLDTTVVNVAVPQIQRSLHFSPTGLSWVLNAYLLAFGGLLLLGGRSGDLLGRRRVFVIGVTVFTLASLLGGLATAGWWLVAARALQGMGGALASPSVLAIITVSFAEGRPRTRAIAAFSATSATSLAFGMILGGALTAWASWRWVLFVNVPIGIIVALLASRVINETERHHGRFDLLGAVTSTTGTAALVYAFIRAASEGWSEPWTLTAFSAAAVLLTVFLIAESRTSQPIMPLRLFAERTRAGAYINIGLAATVLTGIYFYIAQFLQNLLGYSPLRAGLAFLPTTLAMLAAVRTIPRLLPRFGPRRLLLAGTALITGAMAWLSAITPASQYAGSLLGPLLLVGVGTGITVVSLNVTIMSGIPALDAGAASGLLQTVQYSGGAIGLAILTTVYGTAAHNAQRPARTSADHVLAHGIAHAFAAATIFAACALLVTVVLIRTKPPTPTDTPDHPER